MNRTEAVGRRDVLRIAALVAAAAAVEGFTGGIRCECGSVRPVSPSETEIHEGDVFDYYRPIVAAEIEQAKKGQRLVLQSLTYPEHSLNFGRATIQPAASMIKAQILSFAISVNPDLPINGPVTIEENSASDAYRMIVHSNNSATTRVLQTASQGHESQVLNAFNDYFHGALGAPDTEGLTAWVNSELAGVTTNRVKGWYAFPNPISLDSMAQFFRLLEDPAKPLVKTDAMRQLMSIPDFNPLTGESFVTEIEHAVRRAMNTYPEHTFKSYGKNGNFGPGEWSGNTPFNTETVVLSIDTRKFILGYTGYNWDNAKLLDIAVACAVAAAGATNT